MAEIVDPLTGEIVDAWIAGLGEIIANPKQLRGNVRDQILELVRGIDAPWTKMNEETQQLVIDRANRIAADLVVAAVHAVCAGDRPYIHATLDQITIKEGIKATITLGRYSEGRHELNDAVGGGVIIVLPEVDQHMGQAKPARPDVQRELPLEDTTPGAGVPDPTTEAVVAAVTAEVLADRDDADRANAAESAR